MAQQDTRPGGYPEEALRGSSHGLDDALGRAWPIPPEIPAAAAGQARTARSGLGDTHGQPEAVVGTGEGWQASLARDGQKHQNSSLNWFARPAADWLRRLPGTRLSAGTPR
jgi:hypothetical protein